MIGVVTVVLLLAVVAVIAGLALTLLAFGIAALGDALSTFGRYRRHRRNYLHSRSESWQRARR